MSLLLEALKKAALSKRDRAEKEGDAGANEADAKIPVPDAHKLETKEDQHREKSGKDLRKSAQAKSARDEWLARRDSSKEEPSKKDSSKKEPLIKGSSVNSAEEADELVVESHERDESDLDLRGTEEAAGDTPGDTTEGVIAVESRDWSDPFPNPGDLVDVSDKTETLSVDKAAVLEFDPESEDIEIVNDSVDTDLGVDLDLDLHLESDKGQELEAEATARAEASKSAMAELLAQSKEVVARTQRRGIVLYAALFLTSFGSIGAYYYYLTLNDHSVGIPILSDAEESQIRQNQKDIRLKRQRENITSLNDGGQSGGKVDQVVVEKNTPPSDLVAVEPQSLTAQPSTQLKISSKPDITNTSLPEVVIFQDLGTPAQLEMMTLSGGRQNTSPVNPGKILPNSGVNGRGLLGTRVISHQKVAPSDLSLIIGRGYKAYQQGLFDRAKREYDKALKVAPRDRDALLGAGALAIRQGRMQDALHYYRRRISDAPDDAFARAGLLTVASMDGGDSGLKSSIEEMLANSPDTAYLHFLKGSVYAASNEWSPAQSAFFDAYSRERSNPDYAYNLAVSMDHLNQPKEAQHYYQEALRLGETRSSNFEGGPVRMRLSQLQGNER